MKIDAHHHFWNYSAEQYPWIGENAAILKQDFLAEELVAETQGTGVQGVVSVQARESVVETEWLCELAEQSSIVKGVVGWAPFTENTMTQELERLCASKWLKGMRAVLQGLPVEYFARDDFNNGVGQLKKFGLSYDLLILGNQLQAAIEFVDRHPDLPIILDHIAKPTIRAEQFDQQWKTDFLELAKRPHVCCKFSGVTTEVRDPEWNTALLKPYWETAWEAFGSQRLMFGSDWPVCLLRTGYSQWVETVSELATSLSQSEQKAFWSENAIREYRLDVSA